MNRTIKCEGWTHAQRDGRTHGCMTEGKTICPPPLCGRGIKRELPETTAKCGYGRKDLTTYFDMSTI